MHGDFMFKYLTKEMFVGMENPDYYGDLLDQVIDATAMSTPSANVSKFKECLLREAVKRNLIIVEKPSTNDVAIFIPVNKILTYMTPHTRHHLIHDLVNLTIHHGSSREQILKDLGTPDKIHNTKPFPFPCIYQYGNIFFLFPFAKTKEEASSQKLICVYEIKEDKTDHMLLPPG